MKLVAVQENLVDKIWQVNRPDYNSYAAYPLGIEYTGVTWERKIELVREKMTMAEADALVLTALDEIAWLLNIRGYDLPNTPVLRAYAIVSHGSILLFTPKQKISRSLETHLKMDACLHAECVR